MRLPLQPQSLYMLTIHIEIKVQARGDSTLHVIHFYIVCTFNNILLMQDLTESNKESLRFKMLRFLT